MKNNHRQHGDPDIGEREDRIKQRELALAQRQDKQRGAGSQKGVAGKQQGLRKNADGGFEHRGVGSQRSGALLDEYLRRGSEQRATEDQQQRAALVASIGGWSPQFRGRQLSG